MTISADSHIVEPAEVFAGLAQRFGDDGPRLVERDGQPDRMFVPASGLIGLPPARVGVAGYRVDPDFAVDPDTATKPDPEDPDDPRVRQRCAGGYAALRPGIADPAQRAADQDLDGVAAEVLYPSLFFTVFGLERADVVAAAFRNYNDWLADYCSVAPDRLVGAALIPLHDPDAGLAELERAIDAGFRTAAIPCRAPHDRPYGDAAYEPIWSCAEAARIPLAMHVGTAAWAPRSGRGRRRHPIAVYAGAAATIQDTMAELICGGVAHRHPRLTFVCSEFNTGWIANWLDRLDQGWGRDRRAASADLDRPPSGYWATNFVATFEDDRAGVLTRELFGTETLMWGNDYPHRDSTWPASRAVLDAVLAGVPDHERAQLTHGTAARLYRLGS